MENKAHILLVDDNPRNLDVLIGSLKGYEISVALSGEETLELLETSAPDLILLDIMMSGMNGIETCRAIKSKREIADIPIIFLTALSDLDNKLAGFEAGGVDYIAKPLQLLELRARINTHLTIRRQRLDLIRQKVELELKNKEIQEHAEALDRMARTDPLTGLPNRRDFLEKANDEFHRSGRSGKPFSVVLGDIDFFKKINDQFGHDGGDKVLKYVAAVLRGALRGQDLVARWGGEEFILLLPETGGEGGKIAAQNICNAVRAEPFRELESPLTVTMTLGVCEAGAGVTLDDCINCADEALYRGKEAGRNRVMLAG